MDNPVMVKAAAIVDPETEILADPDVLSAIETIDRRVKEDVILVPVPEKEVSADPHALLTDKTDRKAAVDLADRGRSRFLNAEETAINFAVTLFLQQSPFIGV